MRWSFRATVRTPRSGARSASILSCGVFELRHHSGDQFLGVADRFADDLDIHRRLAGRAGALAVDAVLSHEHQRVGEDIERDGEPAARHPHHELMLFQFFAALFVDTHNLILRLSDVGERNGSINAWYLISGSSVTHFKRPGP